MRELVAHQVWHEADARFIVRAVNAHEGLAMACMAAYEELGRAEVIWDDAVVGKLKEVLEALHDD